MSARKEHLLIFGRSVGLEEEHLDEGACVFMEVQACTDDLSVVEHHEGALGQVLRKVVEMVVNEVSIVIDQQL